jgi:AraC family transcriptional activator of pobA
MKKIPVRRITTPNQEQHQWGRFSIRKVDDVVGGIDISHSLHRHDFFFILALKKGKGIHEIDFTTYELGDNVVFILRPGQVHRLELDAHCQGYLIEFDSSFYQPKEAAERLWKKAADQNYYQLAKDKFEKLKELLTHIFEEHFKKFEGHREAIQATLDLFFIELVRQMQEVNPGHSNGAAYRHGRYEQLLRLLEANISSVKSVGQYAKMLNLSIYQLNSITKETVGKSAAGLINEQILLEAKRYLLATPDQVKDIAWHLGYEDPSYFIRFFRKHTGQSPDSFRRNFK